MKSIWIVALLSVLCLPPLAVAEDLDEHDPYLAEALTEAGDNRPELEHVLDHYTVSKDAQKLTAARFLITNMSGKGYVVTELRDKAGNPVEFDTLAYPNFKLSLAALEALEKEHGELEFARDRIVKDLETITAEFLIRHIDGAFDAWAETPDDIRIDFDTFLEYVLPYRGSQEPINDWLTPLRERFAEIRKELGPAATHEELYKALQKATHVRFNERYYLHPTDQGYAEMVESGFGRCEDITNMTTFAARSMAVAIAADYTPAWAHRDNNHAWPVRLDKDGRGSAKSNAHAAKIYRKTYAIQRDALSFRLPEGEQAPNRFLSSTSYIDVTSQYAPTTDVTVDVAADVAPDAKFAYLCVFNGGKWVAIHWSPVVDGTATFTDMGRNICYLPAVFDGENLVAVDAPRVVHKNGMIQRLSGSGGGTDLLVVAAGPKKKSPDTGEVTPISLLKQGETYVLKRWAGSAGWVDVQEVVAGEGPPRFDDLCQDGLYWLVQKESRKLERIFTIESGRQRWW